MFSIKAISSLNLRRLRGVETKTIDEPIEYSCSICKKSKYLGLDSGMMVKISYVLDDESNEIQLCDLCSDVFCDVARFGPRVANELSYWKRKSAVSRMSLIQQELLCFNCLDKLDTHIFLKYDDLKVANKSEVFKTKRLCAKCAISYLSILLSVKSICKAKLPQVVPLKYGVSEYEF